ncbi:hypothetical protein IRP63_13980 (plasmid) [Clostridium botulinum]|uniref:hypothetical protein n=1 Tax=Clostridium botulinum TaxID=1491 RepID=UPI0004D6EF7D|nr:hypothetical protein [Clostridium botulinum]KEH99692.1 hypothetical protein Z952_p0011 [Clostridium botulinum C/D str. BKT75002]KEI05170.1 Transcriptional regulator, XRE family [Clostridium botulinum C/D str. BKT2873]KOC56894.1 hypothetical protein ADU89_01485 [Clostridium botulinum]KOC57369.1 hypothetical protein ADU90_06025 [Clostridium botulinum]MCD3232603.1 hypothetical protein [Clostridium botulinum D/C]
MGALKLQENYYPLPIDAKGFNKRGKKVARRYKIRKRIVATEKTKDVLYKFLGLPVGLSLFTLLIYGFFHIGSDCVNYI